MKKNFLHKIMWLTMGLILLTSSVYAEESTVIIQFNDPTSLCNSSTGKGGPGMYLNYGYKAVDSSEPKYSLQVISTTSWLKSGDSYAVTIPNYPPYDKYDTFTEFYITSQGNPCGDLGWISGGTCDNNQISVPLKNRTLVIQATPVKVPLTYSGYGFQLNCEIIKNY